MEDLSIITSPSENLQHQFLSVVMHVGISPLYIIDSCWSIPDEVSCSHDDPNPTTTHTSHSIINWQLRRHSKTPETLDGVPELLFVGTGGESIIQEGDPKYL